MTNNTETSSLQNISLPTEQQIEDQANSHSGIFKNFRIAPCEYKRFFIFSIMFGIIGFIYSFMRILKDNYVMSRQDPTCILYIKLFYITPLSFVVVILINLLLSKRTVSKLFTIFCIAFMSIFFFLGATVIFEKYIMFDTNYLEASLETFSAETRGLGFFRYLILTVIEPLATAVYIIAELWGSLILSYLFLSYLNEICTEKQHSRFVPPLFTIANIALFLSATVTTLFLHIQEKLTAEQNTVFMGMIFFLEGLLVLIILFCKYYLERYVITTPIFIPEKVKKAKGPKVSPSFREGLEIMYKSKFLLGMCTMICFYSVVFNILETVYKSGIKNGADQLGVERGKHSGRFNSYDQYMTSISVILLNMSSFSKSVDNLGWMTVALITPLIGLISSLCILGLGTYNSAALDESIGLTNGIFGGAKPLIALENYLGTFCLACMKIFKFTAFDVAKERISMRIESKYRPKFKSIYDGIFNKFGKSMGAVYGITLSTFSNEIDFRGFAPITSVFMSIFLAIWIFCVFYLGRSFNKSLKSGEPIDIDLMEDEEQEVNVKEEQNMPVEVIDKSNNIQK